MHVFVLLSIVVTLSLPAEAAGPKLDFNGDDRADVFLRNIVTGELSAWLVDGSRVLQRASYETVAPSTGWLPVAPGDFNGDGRTDLLWYHVNTGELVVWLLDGTRISQTPSYGNLPPSSVWQVQFPR